MLIWESIEKRMGDWSKHFKGFFVTGQFDKIYDVLKADGRRGIKIAPAFPNTYYAFRECKLENLKCVFMGLAPYASFTKEGIPVSDGLAFSCSVTNQEQPSLKLIWDAVFDNYKEEGKRYTDLTFWANQGVLLINMSLTAKKDKPESYIPLWEPFMQYLFEYILSTHTGLPIVFFGKEAQKYEKYTLPMGHYIKKVEHPAFAARQYREFKHDNLFSWVNTILKEHGKEEIKWISTQEEHDQIITNSLEQAPF